MAGLRISPIEPRVHSAGGELGVEESRNGLSSSSDFAVVSVVVMDLPSHSHIQQSRFKSSISKDVPKPAYAASDI